MKAPVRQTQRKQTNLDDDGAIVAAPGVLVVLVAVVDPCCLEVVAAPKKHVSEIQYLTRVRLPFAHPKNPKIKMKG